MSIVKATANSRWKGALLAAVAAGVFAPAAAHATLTVDLSFGASNAHGGSTAFFVTPSDSTSDIPVYVYATITGSGVLTTPPATGTTTTPPVVTGGDFSGLQYLYYNIVNTGAHEIAGGIDTGNVPVLNATLGFNGSGPQPTPASATGVGAQVGTIVNGAPVGATPGLSIGSNATLATATTSALITAALASIPKPRANSPVFQNYASSVTNSSAQTTYTNYGNDGQNIIINSPTSVSFLVETLFYKPNTAGGFSPSTTATPIETTFGAAIPGLPAAVNLATANFYQDVTTENSGTSQATSTASIAPGSRATLFNALAGDANGDGNVNIDDFNLLSGNFNKPGTWAQGDFTGDGVVNIDDFNSLAGNFNKSLVGLSPAVIAADLAPLAAFAAAQSDTAGFNAAIATSPVPEPASLGLLAAAGVFVVGRRRRTA